MRKRNNVIRTRLSDGEYETLLSNLAKSNLTQAAYLRTLISGCEPVEAPPVEYNKLILQLRYIGGNINQIASKLNAFGSTDLKRLYAALEQLDACEKQIISAFLPRKRDEHGHNENMGRPRPP